MKRTLLIIALITLSATGVWGQGKAAASSVLFSREWFDKNGKNTLVIEGRCLCNPVSEYGVMDGQPSKIKVELSNDKHRVLLTDSLTFDEYQIKTMHIRESEIWTVPYRGIEIVFIPVFYCSNYDMETYISYIILYDDCKWIVDVGYMYDIEGYGFFRLNDNLQVKFRRIRPKGLKKLIIEQITSKYTTVKEYEDVFNAVGLRPMPERTETSPAAAISIDDFVGRWYSEYVHDTGNPDDDLFNHSFELRLEKDSTRTNALRGWHFASVGGGRKIDGVDHNDLPSLHGYLRGDTVYIHFVSSWEVEGEAKLYFDPSAHDRSVLIWELGRFESTKESRANKEHYMPQREALQKIMVR